MASDGRVVIDSILNSNGIKRGVADIKMSLNSIKTAADGVSKNMSGALSAAVTMVGAAAAGALVKSVKAGVAFESAFAGVRKTVSANEREFAAMRKEIIGMSKAMPQSAVEISQVAEAAGQLGIAKENVTDFAKTMVMIGETTNMTSDQAATAFARFANITGMSAKNYDRLGSTVVALGNNMATTEGEIVDMSMRLAGTGHMIGLTESQILGVSAAMSSVGINAEAGGSAMSRTMQKMNTAVLDGGSKLKSFASVAGMSANEFASAWRTNPSKALTSFVKGLDGVKRSGGNVAKVLKDLGIGSIQEVDTLMRLSGASDELTKALDLSAKAWGDNSALAKEYGERTKTLESRFKVLMNQVTALGIKIFDALRPALSAIVSMASLAVKALDLIPGPVLAAGLSLVAFAGFIPPVLAGLRAFGLTTLTGAQGLIAFKGIVLGFGRALLGAVASPVGATVAETYRRLGVDQYEIIATLDTKTSDVCRMMDGKVFDLKDRKVGINYPPFHPYCRTVTVPYMEEYADEEETRAARDENGKTYFTNTRTYEEWARDQAESEKSSNESEKRAYKKDRKKHPEIKVDKTVINSRAFADKIRRISDNKNLNENLLTSVKEILKHRDGTLLEDLYLLDFETGKIVYKNNLSTDAQRVVYTQKMRQLLSKNPDSFVAIHNHPQGMPPSASDINAAAKNKYKRGVVVGHDGRVFVYEVHDGFEIIERNVYDLKIGKYKKLRYTEYEAQVKAMESLSVSHHFSIKEVL